jgi:hypothetical protein
LFLLYLYLTSKAGGIPTYKDLIKTIFYTVTLQFGKIPVKMWLLGIDIAILFFGLFLWIVFFSQFILPLRTLQDRYQAAKRLALYLIREHGPAIFVENGKIRERKQEFRKKGPGVVILDTASAAVMRNDFEFTRVQGPGIIFTKKNEYLAKTVDMHARSVRLGPDEGDQPFAPYQIEGEIPHDVYKAIQERRTQTSGLTRDGVEVVPNVGVIYRLKRLPEDKGLSFGFNPRSVRQWVTADGPISTSGIEKAAQRWDNIPLEQLPAYMAVDVWREYLQKFTFGDLFASPFREHEPEQTAYAIIAEKVQERLTQPTVLGLDQTGQPTGRRRPSQEYLALEERGIQVLKAGINNLRFDPSVEARLIQNWIATWLKFAQEERIEVDRRRSSAAVAGRQDSLERFVRAASNSLNPELLALRRPMNDRDEFNQMKLALEQLVQGTRSASLDPQFVQVLQMEDANLRDLLAWIGGQET